MYGIKEKSSKQKSDSNVRIIKLNYTKNYTKLNYTAEFLRPVSSAMSLEMNTRSSKIKFHY